MIYTLYSTVVPSVYAAQRILCSRMNSWFSDPQTRPTLGQAIPKTRCWHWIQPMHPSAPPARFAERTTGEAVGRGTCQ
jgi:hypothetical protein